MRFTIGSEPKLEQPDILKLEIESDGDAILRMNGFVIVRIDPDAQALKVIRKSFNHLQANIKELNGQ